MSPPLALLKLLAGNCSLLFSKERLFNDINGYELMDSPSRGKRGSSRERGRLATIIKTNSSWLILQPSSSSPSSPLIALYLNLYHNNVTLPRIYVYTRAIFFFFFLARLPTPYHFLSYASRLEKKSWKGATRRIRVLAYSNLVLSC